MRRSRYTVAVAGKGSEHLLFNTASGALAVLDEAAFDQFERCAGPHAQAMAEDGFLTELAPEEELAMQKALFEASRDDPSELTLVLAPTYACNLRCPYCYELGHNQIKGKMNAGVIGAICSFVQARHGERGFRKLSVQWYGGDPSLALDVVEDLSSRLIAWCDEHAIEYGASMLTNCNLIDEDAVRMLVRARVESVFITIDGFEDTHNARRVSAVGLNSYEKTVEAARLFAKHGIEVRANMNVDRVNWPEFHPLRDMLRNEVGVDLSCGRLCDYGHFFGTRDFKKPQFDLFDHDEFSRMQHEEFAQGGYDAERFRGMLSASPRFCKGQKNDYYVIDTLGDVYLCDGYIGEQDHVVFNVADEPTAEQLRMVSHDPHESEQCRACHLLPLCQGNCDWERRATGMQCHPLLTTLPDYVRDYRACFGQADAPYVRLA